MGWLVKEGEVRKSWKKRWVIVRSNYYVEYYTHDLVFLLVPHIYLSSLLFQDLKMKGNKKGDINFAGYTLVEDPNVSIAARMKKLAEKMGTNNFSSFYQGK